MFVFADDQASIKLFRPETFYFLFYEGVLLSIFRNLTFFFFLKSDHFLCADLIEKEGGGEGKGGVRKNRLVRR